MDILTYAMARKARGGGSGGGGVSSWNDLTDKPFGEIVVGERSVFYEDSIMATYPGGGSLPVDISPLNGKTVFLTINGNEYNTVCRFASSGHYVIDVGDYKIMQSVLGEGTYLDPVEEYTTYDIKIEVAEVSETKLPEKYMPEHTHLWNDISDKPFDEVVQSETCVFYDEFEPFQTSSTFVMDNSKLDSRIEPGKKYLLVISDNNAVELAFKSFYVETMKFEYASSNGITMTGYMNSNEVTINFGQEISYTWLELIEITETRSKLSLSYISDELYTEIDNRINAVIEEALGGEY